MSFTLGVASITPFTKDGESIDYISLKRLLDHQINGGSQAEIILGTTGESPTIKGKERKKLVEFCVEYINGRALVIIGTGTNDTKESVEYTKFAEKAGADGVLVVVPYYNKPPQHALERHHRSIADATSLPNTLYDIESRVGKDVFLQPETRVKILVGSENVVGFKEASGLEHFIKCHNYIEKARTEGVEIGGRLYKVKQEVGYLSGDDDITHKIIENGGHGAISVLSVIDPKSVEKLIYTAFEARDSGDYRKLKSLLDQGGYLEKVTAVMKLERNPIPIKAAAHMLGLIDHPTMRGPMYPLSELYPEKYKQLEQVVMKYKRDMLRPKA